MGARTLSAPRDRSLLWGLVDTIDGGLLVVDVELAVMHWNAALERLTGLAREAACGRNLKNLVPALDAIALPQHMNEALLGEVSFTAELASGPVDVRCVPLRAEDGHVVGVASFLTDVSERQRRTLIVRAMEAVGRSLASTLDLNQVLDTIVNKTLEVMAADSALVVSRDEE
ncbi:MAG: PAS domain-containing protein, partial [Candidatus Rokuibacteriota bacterium]